MNPARKTTPTPVYRGERMLVLAALAATLLATPVFTLLSAPPPVIGGLWALALAWTVLASFGHALWLGLTHGDWSRFGTCADARQRSRAERFDADTRTGLYAYRRDRERHESLTRRGGGAFD